MGDEELFWRASFVPRVKEFPSENVPKIAFMFLTKGAIPLASLWEKFFKGHEGLHNIYVHPHPLYKDSVPKDSVFHGRRIPSKQRLHAQVQYNDVVRYVLLFGFGLGLGITLSFYLKESSLDSQLNRLSTSPFLVPCAVLNPPPPSTNSSSISNQNKNLVETRILPLLIEPSPPQDDTVSTSPPQDNIVSNQTKKYTIEEFFQPPEITMHDMKDKELFWRASMAPKIQEYPIERVPKLAFLFLTRGKVLLAPIWEKFFQGHQGLYSIYVHSSPSFNETVLQGSVFYGRQIPSKNVSWGEMNMVAAERRLLANALLDISNERFVLVSESCIPLFNFTTIYKHLIHSEKSHVESFDLPGPVGRGRYSSEMEPVVTIEQWRKGSQWFEMDRFLAIEVISDQTYFPVFSLFCKDACYGDEHYLPTFVGINFLERNLNRTLTYVDWSKGGPHPYTFESSDVTKEFLEKLRNSSCYYNGEKADICYLFARKFAANTLDRLLSFAPEVMYF
ncbi:PREDICTED: uncharacterized protein LOC18604152 [Theobroma cacao]|uniref:Uncharacterized protein LOC18604152 n=1 Tax=Theobroma cacao TaxID=3641 RepID=A0AB32VD21_THECC|nr:PREDICTED: uncharacterized protein LOC18604152 [Theobroma cacao]